jgi:hypothetical protein
MNIMNMEIDTEEDMDIINDAEMPEGRNFWYLVSPVPERKTDKVQYFLAL